MTIYAKIKEDGSLEFAPTNKGSISNWINNKQEVLADGYLEYEESVHQIDEELDKYVIKNNKIISIYKKIIIDENNKRLSRINELQSFLDTTDRYVVRKFETGKEMPIGLKEERQRARDEISKLTIVATAD